MRGDEAYVLIRDAIADTTPVGEPSRFVPHELYRDRLPRKDRHFCLVQTSHDREIITMGNDERTLVIELVVAYQWTQNVRIRSIRDGDGLIDSIMRLIGTGGITNVVELGTASEEDEEGLLISRFFQVDYSGTF